MGRRVRLSDVDYRVVQYNHVEEKHDVQRLDRDDAPVEWRQLRRGEYELLDADAHEVVPGASADDPLCAKCGQVQPGGIRSFEQLCVNEACEHLVAFGLGRASGVGSATTTARGEVLLAANQTPARPDYRNGNGSDSGDRSGEEGSGGWGGSGSESDDESDVAGDEQAAEPPNAAARKKQAQPLSPTLMATLTAKLAAAVDRQERAGAALVAAAPNQAASPPLPPVGNPAAAAQPQVQPQDARAEFDALRLQLAANPPADSVTCLTDAALVAYRCHAQDPLAEALPVGWVTTAAGALGNKVARWMEKVVARTQEALAQGSVGVCIGPLNNGKCKYRSGSQPPGRAKVYLWNAEGLNARARIIEGNKAVVI